MNEDSEFEFFGCSCIVASTVDFSRRVPAQPTKANRGRETARYVSQHPSDIAPAHGYAARSMPTRTRTGPPQRRTPRQGARILLPQQRRHNACPSARADPRCDQRGRRIRGFRMQLHCRLRSCFQRTSSLLLETRRYRVAIAGRSMAANPRRCKGRRTGAKHKTGEQCPRFLSARWDGPTMLFPEIQHISNRQGNARIPMTAAPPKIRAGRRPRGAPPCRGAERAPSTTARPTTTSAHSASDMHTAQHHMGCRPASRRTVWVTRPRQRRRVNWQSVPPRSRIATQGQPRM